jgi:hypothetical protein
MAVVVGAEKIEQAGSVVVEDFAEADYLTVGQAEEAAAEAVETE